MNKKVLHEVIEAVSQRHPGREAIRESRAGINYAGFQSWFTTISSALVQQGLQVGQPVGVYLESGIDYVSSIIGVNKAGGIFMPLELQYPVKRLQYILNVVRPSIIITRESLRASLLEKLEGVDASWLKQVFYVDRDGQLVICEDRKTGEVGEIDIDPATTAPVVSGDDSNYLLYTSGSTGEPKIIEGCHKSLSHFMHWEVGEFQLDEHTRTAQLVPLSFDVSLRDIFAPLVAGGTLVVPDGETKLHGGRLVQWLQEEGITLLHTVPSVLRMMMREMKESGKRLTSLQHIILAGEALYGRDVLQWRTVNNNTELVNIYGPTETTLAKVFNRIGADAGEPNAIIPLGVPINNTSILIINNRTQCKTGAVGEIHIKTPFITKGYYRDEAMTREKFIQNPLHNEYTDIVYKTGDFGRYLKDGSIGFAGRQDNQLKIRGNRVEISEVETSILGMPGMEQVIVIPHKQSEGDEVLCCYYRGEVQEVSNIRAYLQERLPDYMHPSYYLYMDEFPLALNGKIDRRALPAPQELLEAQFPYHAPETELQSTLATIWSEVLGLQRVGIHNSFFELGGHSLTATKVVSRIYKTVGIDLNLKDFFDHPRIDQLSAFLENKKAGEYKPIVRTPDAPDYPVSPAQKLVWILDQSAGGLSAYNIPASCIFGKELQKDALEWSLQQLVNRHESLRTSFTVVDGEPRQRVQQDVPFVLQQTDASHLAGDEDAIIDTYLRQEFNELFDLTRAPLLRARLVSLKSGRYLFLCTLHHLVGDGWSMGVLIKDMLAYYQAYGIGQAALEPLQVQYRDYVIWQQEQLQSSKAVADRMYWQEKLSGVLPVLNLPLDFPRPAKRSYRGAKRWFRLDQNTSAQVRTLCKKEDASLFMFFMSAVKLLLYGYSGQSDIIVGSPISGRDHEALEDQIGFYLNNLVLRDQVNGQDSFIDFLRQVKQTILDAYAHQAYPFYSLVEELNKDAAENRNALYDVLVVLDNAELSGSKEDNEQLKRLLGAEEVRVQEDISKLDLTFFIMDEEEISISIEYGTELFTAATIEKMERDLRELVKMVLAKKDASVRSLAFDLAARQEKETLAKIKEKNLNAISEEF
jgi:mycobactin peptide synthetase MbtE